MTYTEFQRSLLWELAATMPTPDEWDYLCGGGCRTLFPGRDGLDHSMHLHHFESEEDRGKPYDMEQANFFGLAIAYDPYMLELVDGKTLTICGGTGPLVGYMPVPLTADRRFGLMTRYTVTMAFSVLLSGCRHPDGEWNRLERRSKETSYGMAEVRRQRIAKTVSWP